MDSLDSCGATPANLLAADIAVEPILVFEFFKHWSLARVCVVD